MEFFKKVSELFATTKSVIDVFRHNSDVDGELLRLETTLTRAEQLFERSECWRFRYQPIDKLFLKLKACVYVTEILLEELEYMKQRIEAAKWRLSGEFVNYFEKWLTGFPEKVKRAEVNANHVCDELERTCNSLNIPINANQFSKDARPETTESLPDFEVYGRDNELNYAIRLLGITRSGPEIANGSSTERRNVSVLPIVGVGGVGKTTLAQKIYNTVKFNFTLQIWVCVSDKSIKEVIKEILEALGANEHERNQANLNSLQQILQKKLKSKKVLLVLDDIWNKDWLPILGSMKEASEGSVVVLTSRLPQAVEYNGTNINSLEYIKLEGLKKQDYWEFFKICAGLNVNSENCHQLKDIGKQICGKLKGSPLAAKTLGGILRKNFDHGYWMNIRDSKMWELEQEQHDIFPILILSYQHLPSNLKKCFSFCSLFPKDHKFTANELITLWIMQGFVPQKETLKNMEDLALNFFHDLVNRCFFQADPRWASHEKKGYVIHDLMHDVCQYVTKDECHCLKDGNFEKICLDIQHLSLFNKNLRLEGLKELRKFTKLRSLIVFYHNNCGSRAIGSWLNDLTNIRSLSIAKCKINKLPESIGKLKHLYYLDISGTKIEKLPESFCSLYNLQYLDMRGCSKIVDFPGCSDKLTRLKYFRPPINLAHLLSRTPNLSKAIQNYNLIFPVTDDGKIEILKHQSGIQGFLEIAELNKVPRKQAAQEAQLHEQGLLDLLRLNGISRTNTYPQPPYTIKNTHEEVLDGLCPHRNLKELEIFNYDGENLSPSWMGENLPNLRRIKLHGCLINPAVINFPHSIAELQLIYCPRLTSLQNCLQPNLLPNLKPLAIICKGLESLPVESFDRFLSLEKLTVSSCSKLICPRKMVLPPSVKELILCGCGQLEDSIPSCLKNLTSLTRLMITDCQRLVSIPEEVMRDLKSLRSLEVWSCPALQSLGEAQFPASLKHLKIVFCRHLQLTGGKFYDGIPFSVPAIRAAAQSSSDTIRFDTEMQLIETPSTAPAIEAAAPGSSHAIPSIPAIQLTGTSSIDTPAIEAAVPASSQAIQSTPEIQLTGIPSVDTTLCLFQSPARETAAPSSLHAIPSTTDQIQLAETSLIDTTLYLFQSPAREAAAPSSSHPGILTPEIQFTNIPSIEAAEPISSHTGPPIRELQLIENLSTAPALESAVPSSSHTMPSTPEIQLTENPSIIDVSSTMNVRKRKVFFLD